MSQSVISIQADLTDNEYLTSLKKYQSEIRKSAESEIIELKQIAAALKRQIDLSLSNFKSTDTKTKTVKEWRAFNKNWSELQQQIIDAFGDLDSPKFVNDLFYAPIYFQLRSLSIQLMNMQKNMDANLKSNQVPSSFREQIDSIVAKNEKSLDLAQAQIRLMEANFMASQGLPSRVGLWNE
jgi:hypothetical protein